MFSRSSSETSCEINVIRRGLSEDLVAFFLAIQGRLLFTVVGNRSPREVEPPKLGST